MLYIFLSCFAVHEPEVESEERPRKNQMLSPRASTISPLPLLPVPVSLYVLSHEVERPHKKKQKLSSGASTIFPRPVLLHIVSHVEILLLNVASVINKCCLNKTVASNISKPRLNWTAASNINKSRLKY